MTIATTPHQAGQTKVAIGGTSVEALFGPMAGGWVTNPLTIENQGISPLLTYTYISRQVLQGPFNTAGFNSPPPYNAKSFDTKTEVITFLGDPEPLFVSIVGPAQTRASATTIVLQPSQTFIVPTNCQSSVWVNAATSGHRFTAVAFQPETQYPPTLVPSGFPPLGPSGLTKTLPAYLYQEYNDDDDLQALVMSYNDLAQAFVDWVNALNLPVYPTLSGALLDWVGRGLYGLARPTLYSGLIRALGPYNTSGFNSGPVFNDGGIINDVTDVAVTSDDTYKRILTWHFFKADGKETSALWLKKRIYRFLYGVNGWDAEGSTDQISIEISPETLAITIVTGIRRTVSGSFFNGCGFNSGPVFNGGSFSLQSMGQPALAPQFQEAVQTGALEMPQQYVTTCRIGIIGKV